MNLRRTFRCTAGSLSHGLERNGFSHCLLLYDCVVPGLSATRAGRRAADRAGAGRDQPLLRVIR